MRKTSEINDPVWQDIWDRDEAIEQLTQRLAAAEAAARWFWREVSCQTVHHSMRQQHEFNEPCPVLQGALKKWPFLQEAAKGGEG